MKLLVRLRRLAVAFQPGEKSENKIAGKPMPSRRKKENYYVDDRQAKQEEKGFDAQR